MTCFPLGEPACLELRRLRRASPASSTAPVSAVSKSAGYTGQSARETAPAQQRIAEWIETYGEDSDFVRVRVRGLPPAAYELKFIDRERILDAGRRDAPSLDDAAARNVIAFRRATMRAPCRGSGSQADTRAIAVCWLATGRDSAGLRGGPQGNGHFHRYGVWLADRRTPSGPGVQ
jgi:hypothetical protein